MLIRILILSSVAFGYLVVSSLFIGLNADLFHNLLPLFLILAACLFKFWLSLPLLYLKQSILDLRLAMGALSEPTNSHEWIQEMVDLASHYRKEGALALDVYRTRLKDPLIADSLRFLQESWEPQTVQSLFDKQASHLKIKLRQSAQVWHELSDFAPVAGIMVSVLYVILFLFQYEAGKLNFLTLAYSLVSFLFGLLLSHFIFSPLKLHLDSYALQVGSRISAISAGVCGVLQGSSPAQIEAQMKKQMGA